MMQRFNSFLDFASDYLAARKGLLPMIGIVLVLANLVLHLTSWSGWLTDSDLLLHLGVIVAIIGFLLAWAL